MFEEQGTLTKRPKVPISTIVDEKLWSLAKKAGIGWSEAIELGIKIKLADLDLHEYPSCKLKDQRDRARRNFMELTKQTQKEENGETEDEENNNSSN